MCRSAGQIADGRIPCSMQCCTGGLPATAEATSTWACCTPAKSSARMGGLHMYGSVFVRTHQLTVCQPQ
eukprot:359962-Chlamydomonas_euryale.AAC.4